MVEVDEFAGGVALGIEQACLQAPGLAPGGAVGQCDGDPRLDHPDRQEPVAGAGPIDGRVQGCQVGTVGQALLDDRAAAGGGADQEPGLGVGEVVQEVDGVEVRIRKQQHRAVQASQKAGGIREFTAGLGAEAGCQDCPGAALDDDQQPQERVAELGRVPGPLGVAPGGLLGVGGVQEGAVDGDGAQTR